MNNTPCKNTIEWFKTLTNIQNTEECLRIILPSITALQSRVRRTDYVVDEIPALSYAAACLAMYRMSLSGELTRYSSFKAGDITLKTSQNERRKTMLDMLEFALCEAKPYLKTGKVFKSINGGAV